MTDQRMFRNVVFVSHERRHAPVKAVLENQQREKMTIPGFLNITII
jgi:hypothetical protein